MKKTDLRNQNKEIENPIDESSPSVLDVLLIVARQIKIIFGCVIVI